jgi:sodium/hydrogen antiporter
MHTLDTVIAICAGAVILLGIVSARVQRSLASVPLLALLVGVAAGPHGTGLLDPFAWPEHQTILKEVARFTLAISVVGIALRTPREDYRRLLRPVAVLLTLGMLGMWGISSLLAWAALGIAPVVALSIGAAAAPTDPVVANAIVAGPLAGRQLPDRVRSTLSLESGANDGLGYLFVMLPILLIQHPGPAEALGRWLADTLLQGVVLAVVLGLLIGWGTARLLGWAMARRYVEHHSFLSLGVALALLATAGTRLLGADGILAAFAAGAAFNLTAGRKQDYEEQNVEEAIGRLFTIPVFVLLGLALPVAGWVTLGWAGPALTIAILLLRRPLVLLALSPLLGPKLDRDDRLFLGWFGPVGVAAIYYALHSAHETGNPTLWPATSLVVVASIVAHGLTAKPGIALYNRAERRPA